MAQGQCAVSFALLFLLPAFYVSLETVATAPPVMVLRVLAPESPVAAQVENPLRKMELVCPAGSLPALKAAVDEGADCVYLGFRDATNARNFAGLNFDEAAITTGIA